MPPIARLQPPPTVNLAAQLPVARPVCFERESKINRIEADTR
jgi:hypothetical protein